MIRLRCAATNLQWGVFREPGGEQSPHCRRLEISEKRPQPQEARGLGAEPPPVESWYGLVIITQFWANFDKI